MGNCRKYISGERIESAAGFRREDLGQFRLGWDWERQENAGRTQLRGRCRDPKNGFGEHHGKNGFHSTAGVKYRINDCLTVGERRVILNLL